LSSADLTRESSPNVLTRRDVRVLLLWLLAALVGASVAYRYFFRAFPEASVDFKVTRADALERARAFATGQHSSLQGYQSAIVFNVDDDTKTFLEREVGLEQANRLMSSEVTVWYWDARFFRPQQKEELRVRVDPKGGIVGYDHVLEEAAPGARLDQNQALAHAEQFLTQAVHIDLGAYQFLPEEANSNARPNRTDWSFTWERKGFRVKDAPYRLQVTIEGDKLGGFAEFLKVPEAWQRDYARLRSANNFIETIALIPYAILIGAALSVLIMLGRRGLVRWKWAIGIGLFITALYFAMQLNEWPLIRAGYDTNYSYASFVATEIVKALAGSLATALLVVIAVAPGEPLYRAGQPNHLRLGSAFTLAGLRTRQFFVAGCVGLCLAAVHIGYVVAFYVVGRRFGVWAPQDLQYSDTLSTALPWISALTIGIYAAASEEFLFRMFSIRFLTRVTNWRILAIVLPAFAWGFLHSNYPQEPPYIRGIEVGTIGIVAGLVMLRWGILATLTWHYTVDAFLTSLSLMRSHGLYTRISGGLVGFAAVIPVAVAGILYLKHGAFRDETDLLNSAQPLHEAATALEEPRATAEPALAYQPLNRRAATMLAAGGVLGFALLLAIKPQAIGSFVRFPLNTREAGQRADDVLRQLRQIPPSYHRAVTTQYTFDPLVNEYLRRTIGVEAVNQIYRDEVPAAFWTARYFRDSQKEEYFVVLRPDGTLHSVHHTLAEAAPGPNLTKEEAQARAENFLRDSKKIDLSQWKLVEAQSKKLPARTDHNFVWEEMRALNPSPSEAEAAHVRISLVVQGDEVSGYRIFIHLPEDWVRRQNETTLANTAQTVLFLSLISAFGLAVLVIFFRTLKSPHIAAVPWRRIAGWSLVVLACSLLRFVSLEPLYLLTYRTDQPFATFIGTLLIGQTLSAVLFYGAATLLLGLGSFFLICGYGSDYLPFSHSLPGSYYRDAILAMVSGWAVVVGLNRLHDVFAVIWPVAHYAYPASVPEGLDANWPALNSLTTGITHSLLAMGMIALVLGFAARYLRQSWIQAALLAALAIFSVQRWGSAGDFLQSSVFGFVELAVIWWGARRLVRLNLLAYFLLVMLLALSPAIDGLIRQPNAYYRINGAILITVVAILVVLPLFWWRAAARRHRVADRFVVPA
jgi:membrane protease YdiL (CAAX protease family)